MKAKRIFVAIIAIIALAIAVLSIKWNALSFHRNISVPDPAPTAVVETMENDTYDSVWYHFYNSDLQDNGNEEDNFNFGSNPREEGLKAVEYDSIFRETLWNDPAIGAADLAWFDAKFGTSYLGTYYESCKGDWAKTINEAKEAFMADQDMYHETLNAFFGFLDQGEVSLYKVNYGITDQMYMNPYTADGVPEVVVMETNDHEGLFLKYTFKIKGSTTGGADGSELAVMYRIDCRFQPCNVASVMNIAPQESPSKPSSTTTPTGGGGSNPDPVKPNPDPVKPDPTPTPNPYNKDKTQGTQGDPVKPNDNPGPGPNTNNGAGAWYSTQDQPENSNHETSYPDYKEDVRELEVVNQEQRTGSDNNTPSTTPRQSTSNNTNVDNNGDRGTGNGGINNPTGVTSPVHPVDGSPINNISPGEPDGAWGGPPD